MSRTVSDFKIGLPKEWDEYVNASLRNLFENYHLYQSFELDFNWTKEKEAFLKSKLKAEWANHIPPNCRNLGQDQYVDFKYKEMVEFETELRGSPWTIVISKDRTCQATSPHRLIIAPNININCCNCGCSHPTTFSLGDDDTISSSTEFNIKNNDGMPHQVFTILYRCKSCETETYVFMLTRNGAKLKISGRSEIERVILPKSIPKKEACFIRDAIIAHNTGNHLPASFMLRCFIEQYLRRITNAVGKDMIDDLTEKYSNLLHDEFPRSRIGKFKSIYGEISESIHEGDRNSNKFDSYLEDIYAHFDLLKHHPLQLETK